MNFTKVDDIRNKVLKGNVLDVIKEIPSESIDVIITSPPYWSLRNYDVEDVLIGGDVNCKHMLDSNLTCKICKGWFGQIGLEPTLDLYIEHMLLITKELKRVLKNTGLMFWVHNDCYNSGGKFVTLNERMQKLAGKEKSKSKYLSIIRPSITSKNIPNKSQCLQNFRLIIKMIDKQNWILRNVIIWYKPNSMPDSTRDRLTNVFEYVFMLTKAEKYFFNLDAIRSPYKKTTLKRVRYYSNKFSSTKNGVKLGKGVTNGGVPVWINLNELGKNPGNLWSIATHPFHDAHFAVFPEQLVEPMIRVGCPKFICRKCGFIKNWNGKIVQNKAECNCKIENKWKPGIILDPFFGTGTVGVVAKKLGRDFVGIELSDKYIKMANKRLYQYKNQITLDHFFSRNVKRSCIKVE